MKFRAGDTVRVINRTSKYFDQVATVQEVIEGQHTPFGLSGLESVPVWFGPHDLILAEKETLTFSMGEPVRVIADPMRNGRYAGRLGSIASNVLGGTVWVFLSPNYANFHTADLEASEKP